VLAALLRPVVALSRLGGEEMAFHIAEDSIIKQPVLAPVSACGSTSEQNFVSASKICSVLWKWVFITLQQMAFSRRRTAGLRPG
jgi:hypothetical protein